MAIWRAGGVPSQLIGPVRSAPAPTLWRPRDGAEEIGLILGGVACPQQFRPGRGVAEPGVVARRKPGGTEALRVAQAEAELDFAVAQHVRVGGAAAAVFAQEFREYLPAIVLGKTDPVQDDTQLAGRGARVLVILRAGAVAVLILPVGHKQAVHLMAGFEQQQGGDRRINAA